MIVIGECPICCEQIYDSKNDFTIEDHIDMVHRKPVLDELLTATEGLADYRKRIGPLSFQLEKADDWIGRIQICLDQLAGIERQASKGSEHCYCDDGSEEEQHA